MIKEEFFYKIKYKYVYIIELRNQFNPPPHEADYTCFMLPCVSF